MYKTNAFKTNKLLNVSHNHHYVITNVCFGRYFATASYVVMMLRYVSKPVLSPLLTLQFSHGLVNSAMGQIPCSTERISCYLYY